MTRPFVISAEPRATSVSSRNRVGRDRQTGCKGLEQNEAERIRPARKDERIALTLNYMDFIVDNMSTL